MDFNGITSEPSVPYQVSDYNTSDILIPFGMMIALAMFIILLSKQMAKEHGIK